MAVLLAVAPVGAAAAACGDAPGLRRIEIVADVAMNDYAPVAVEVVHVEKRSVLRRLTTLSAHDYFAAREALKRDLGRGLETHYFEIVPGSVVAGATPAPCRHAGTLIFANYARAGSHRIATGPARKARLYLLRESIVWFADGAVTVPAPLTYIEL